MKRDKLDDLFSRYIRLRDDKSCRYCGKYVGMNQGLHCAHYHSRWGKTTRWDEDNAVALCVECHFYFGRHPNRETEFFRSILGSKKDEELDRRAHMTIKEMPIDKEEIKARLIEKIEMLEGE